MIATSVSMIRNQKKIKEAKEINFLILANWILLVVIGF
jgi:hypothetical protein